MITLSILLLVIILFFYNRIKAQINIRKNIKMLTIESEKGRKVSQFSLGVIYLEGIKIKGIKIPKNYQKAFDLISKSSDQNFSPAQNTLGQMYYKGKGVPQNYTLAFYFYSRAANQGDPNAQLCLGIMYMEGEGITKNYSIAAEWLTKAANQGNENAKEGLRIIRTQLIN